METPVAPLTCALLSMIALLTLSTKDMFSATPTALLSRSGRPLPVVLAVPAAAKVCKTCSISLPIVTLPCDSITAVSPIVTSTVLLETSNASARDTAKGFVSSCTFKYFFSFGSKLFLSGASSSSISFSIPDFQAPCSTSLFPSSVFR